MHEKILNFILLNTMHMVMIHLILLWVFLTLNHFYSLYCILHQLYDGDAWWYFFGLRFVALVSLSTQSPASYWAIKDLLCPSYAANVSHTYEYFCSCLLATHPFLISAHSHDHQPKTKLQVISSPLMLPICANKLGHAIISNSISR